MCPVGHSLGTGKGFPALLYLLQRIREIRGCIVVYFANLSNWYGPLSMQDNFSNSG